jgi:hypothetical protein
VRHSATFRIKRSCCETDKSEYDLECQYAPSPI